MLARKVLFAWLATSAFSLAIANSAVRSATLCSSASSFLRSAWVARLTAACNLVGALTNTYIKIPASSANTPPPTHNPLAKGELVGQPVIGMAANCQEPLGRVTSNRTGSC